ncbi:hypothetical protein [Rhodococcus sp. NCIMB 12038]|uniref:hypothetical protein n=1 Tax=Rhodococcus sp. NCIMB 12038 TaxID=933800 RepID=UPI000B3C97CB|nr:hypothetical protein [Rhodococcus sp. NCIMB 12038]OUS97257.1 hypothetical protein CA951_02610 [Rhodococcus sp. NCIMB 12038]
MLHITLDLHAATDLVDSSEEWSDLDKRFQELDPHDPDNRTDLIHMVRELIEDRAGPVRRDLFRLVDDSDTSVHIFADFHCDQYGEITNDHHLSLSVMVGAAPLIMDPGIKNLLELPVLEEGDDDELGAVSVLAGVVDYANSLIRRAAETFARPLPAAAPVQLPPPLELRVVTVDGVRDQADPAYSSELSAADRERLLAASDTDISEAIAASWPVVADRFHRIHDELQTAALERLLS